MKSLLLAGLLAGLSLGGMAHAQPPSASPSVLAQKGGTEDDDGEVDAKMHKMNGKQAKCVVDCQKPMQACTQRCKKKGGGTCHDKCGEQLTACMQKCGINADAED